MFTDTWLIFGGNLFLFFFPLAYLINHVENINARGLIGENYMLYIPSIYLPIPTPNAIKHSETESYEKVVCNTGLYSVLNGPSGLHCCRASARISIGSKKFICRPKCTFIYHNYTGQYSILYCARQCI